MSWPISREQTISIVETLGGAHRLVSASRWLYTFGSRSADPVYQCCDSTSFEYEDPQNTETGGTHRFMRSVVTISGIYRTRSVKSPVHRYNQPYQGFEQL